MYVYITVPTTVNIDSCIPTLHSLLIDVWVGYSGFVTVLYHDV